MEWLMSGVLTLVCISVAVDIALKITAHEKEEKKFIVEQDFWGETNSDLE